MRKTAALAAALLMLAACSREAPWESFKTAPALLGAQTVTLGNVLIPAKIDGIGWSWLQLDLGADTTFLYGGTIRRYHVPIGADARLHGALGAHEQSFDGVVSGTIDGGQSDGRPIVGILGADFFITHALALDLVHNRYALAPTVGQLPNDVSDVVYVPMRYESTGTYRNKLVLAMQVGQQKYERAMLDVGSSPFALVVNVRDWPAITGRSLRDRRNTRVNANQFGLPVALIGAPTAGALHVGSARLASPLAYAVTAGTSAAAIAQPFDGVIGNALFAGHVLVVDVPAGRLGMKVAP